MASRKLANPSFGAFTARLRAAGGRFTKDLRSARSFELYIKSRRVRAQTKFTAKTNGEKRLEILSEIAFYLQREERKKEKRRARYAISHRARGKDVKPRRAAKATEVSKLLKLSKKDAREFRRHLPQLQTIKTKAAPKIVTVVSERSWRSRVNELKNIRQASIDDLPFPKWDKAFGIAEISPRSDGVSLWNEDRKSSSGWMDVQKKLWGALEPWSIRFGVMKYLRPFTVDFAKSLQATLPFLKRASPLFEIALVTNLKEWGERPRATELTKVRLNFTQRRDVLKKRIDSFKYDVFKTLMELIWDETPFEREEVTSSGVQFVETLRYGKSRGKNLKLTQNFKLAFTVRLIGGY